MSTKHERSIATQAASASTARWQKRAAMDRKIGVVSALGAGVALSQFEEMLPDIPAKVPLVGGKKAHAVAGGLLAVKYAFTKNPSKAMVAAGWIGAAAFVRGM